DLVRCNSNKSEDRHVLVNFSANGASEELKQALSLDSLFGLKGLVAVVTGGGTGIGLMCTQALAAHGARGMSTQTFPGFGFVKSLVYITGRREEVLKQAVDNYHKHAKGEIIGLQADVTNKADLERIIGKISEKEPNGIQILVNNAGISGPKMEAFSNGHTIHAILEKVSGMVNISQNHFAYNASKAAAIHLTKVSVSALKFSLRSIRMMACELANSQIRFNSIAPGVFPSAMYQNPEELLIGVCVPFLSDCSFRRNFLDGQKRE
ncbi:hypothetical protein PSTT_14239, partial [Puccinia striiformis]